LGAAKVTLIVGRSRELAPVHKDDLAQAEKEGVKILFLARPARLVVKGKKLAGMRCVRLMEGDSDATGRREILEISGSEFEGDADLFVDAYARGIDVRGFASTVALAKHGGGAVAVGRGVFVAGDLATGPRSVVEAVQSGQKAAYGIHHYLSGETVESPFDLTIDEAIGRREFTLEAAPRAKTPRYAMLLAAARERRADFNEVEKGYSAQVARREAQRCLRCGPCGECEICVDICEKKDFLLRVKDEFAVNIHAGREFWSDQPERVVLELGDERAEASPVRTVCSVSEELCIGCGRCQDVCGYKAVSVEARPGGRFIARVDELACKGCGSCVSVCPTGAIDQRNFESDRLMKRLAGIMPASTKVLFVCHWARPGRLDLPGDVLVIETMCVGRLTPRLIMEAVLSGSPRVLVCGCDETDCHYGFGRRGSKAVVERSRALLRLFGFKSEIVTEISTSPEEFALAVNKWAWKTK
jgi:formate dehydrogenase major subunit